MHKIPPTSGQDSLSNILKAVVCIVSHSWFRKPAKSIKYFFLLQYSERSTNKKVQRY